MSDKKTQTGGGSFHKWWKDPKNRQKVYESDKEDAAYLQRLKEDDKNPKD